MKERAKAELLTYMAAMDNEVACNAHKGDWRDMTRTEAAHETLYHAMKLAMALRTDDREAILEYAADTGVCAMYAADVAGALDARNITTRHAESRWRPWGWRQPYWKRRSRLLTRRLMRQLVRRRDDPPT